LELDLQLRAIKQRTETPHKKMVKLKKVLLQFQKQCPQSWSTIPTLK